MAVLHVALAIDLGEMKAARDKSLLKGHAPRCNGWPPLKTI
jgi:hypothetical protein